MSVRAIGLNTAGEHLVLGNEGMSLTRKRKCFHELGMTPAKISIHN